MRLIDADALIDYIESDRSGLMSAREFQRDYIECIEEMPTAYDVDKVVAQIKSRRFISDGYNTTGERQYIRIDEAIEIIKAGGVNER